MFFCTDFENGGLMSAAERRGNAIFDQDSNPFIPWLTQKYNEVIVQAKKHLHAVRLELQIAT